MGLYYGLSATIQTISSDILTLGAVAMFAILFVTILACIKRMGMFGPRANIMMALSITLLCMIGLQQAFFPPPGEQVPSRSHPGHGFNMLLLPYGALAVAIVAMLLLRFVRRVLGGHQRTSGENGPARHLLWGLLRRRAGPSTANRMPQNGAGHTEIESESNHHWDGCEKLSK